MDVSLIKYIHYCHLGGQANNKLSFVVCIYSGAGHFFTSSQERTLEADGNLIRNIASIAFLWKQQTKPGKHITNIAIASHDSIFIICFQWRSLTHWTEPNRYKFMYSYFYGI